MDQEKINVPKYLQGYKDPEKRKAYFRERMRERYRSAQRAKGKEVKMHKPPEQQREEATTSAIEKTLAIAKDLTPEGDDDPILKAISQYGKYVPLIIEGLKGFNEAAKNYGQLGQPQAPPPRQGPVPPPGWNEFPPMEKIKRKYNPDGTESSWWLAGERYEREQSLGVSSYPVPMEATYAGAANAARDQQERTRRSTAPPPQDNRSFRDLEREAANFGPKESGDVPVVEAKPGAHMTAAQIAAMQRGEEPVAEITIDAEEALQKVGAAMTEDVRRNLDLVVNYFKMRDIKSFEKDLGKAEEYAKTWGPILNATLGFHVKETVKRTTPEELLELLSQQDPQKAALIKKKKLEPKLRDLWAGLQHELSGS